MMKIEFKTGGAAFNDPYTGEPFEMYEREECIRILKEIIEKLKNGYSEGVCMDINGVKVGTWKLK
jgi:hypothetical protein